MAFECLLRFINDRGETCYGNVPRGVDIASIVGKEVDALDGSPQAGFTSVNKQSVVKEVLCPIAEVHIFQCIGLNYRQHAKEAKATIAPYPVVFSKPPDARAGPYDDVHVHRDAQSKLDYEGELTVIIGKDCKDVNEDDALNHVLGYAVGNDISARNFQAKEVSGGQFGYAKSFDRFAPIGPVIVSPLVIKDPQNLEYTTKVNGELRQKTNTSDMIWSVRQIIAHLSRGTTLRAGSAIMTGTPSGVALFMEGGKGFLKHGDVVEIEVEEIGAIKNRIVFDA
ncbi:uncharacterized protein AB675_8306 [Cyphellophora attinorum]|uniref:Fumarylacetoacetase-like C-terminal domain-containing protein n=1 Tax=Cyphellophora attinorum TaxID=1664694 RepID=A0A0N0NQV3_9EURO|nr:uncharacterized protein AB675_8306 [Phialophora attinorum]KPI44361.1 hypothetical protein AB675_8306 [Phialophora attinorum]